MKGIADINKFESGIYRKKLSIGISFSRGIEGAVGGGGGGGGLGYGEK